ncbi:MAG: MGMT family protein [Candidatus Wolfebacteria bacterium]|nr:MGMT family protein [Candidatus Wolfebacteria bacterium]
MSSFKEKVLKIVSQIPKGKILTYKQVAIKAGKPMAYRAVGNIMARNHNPGIPCHRVIRSDGRVGGYNRGSQEKKLLLIKEGAIIK